MSEIVDRFFPAIFGFDVFIMVCGLMFLFWQVCATEFLFLVRGGSFSRLPGRSNQVNFFCFTCRGGMAM